MLEITFLLIHHLATFRVDTCHFFGRSKVHLVNKNNQTNSRNYSSDITKNEELCRPRCHDRSSPFSVIMVQLMNQEAKQFQYLLQLLVHFWSATFAATCFIISLEAHMYKYTVTVVMIHDHSNSTTSKIGLIWEDDLYIATGGTLPCPKCH